MNKKQSNHSDQIKKVELSPFSNPRLQSLCGPLDEHLKQIEIALDVKISRHQACFTIQGTSEDNIEYAGNTLEYLYAKAHQDLSIDDIQLALLTVRHTPLLEPVQHVLLQTNRPNLQGRTPRQVQYIQQIQANDITFGIGPAGTGKTYLAVACAVDALQRDHVKRIILTRPAVEAGEHLGFLPGDLNQKVDPYLRPLYDALYDLLGFDRVQKLFERHVIEIAPLAYMRGRTLNHAFIILDEAQNTTPEQMKMFLTRLGIGSKAVITGDITQIDLHRSQQSGLFEVQEILHNVHGISFMEFASDDVVRHPLVQRIVNAYEKYPSKNVASIPKKTV